MGCRSGYRKCRVCRGQVVYISMVSSTGHVGLPREWRKETTSLPAHM